MKLKNYLYDKIANIFNRRVEYCGSCESPNVKILVMQHYPCKLPDVFCDNRIYFPMQCGAELADRIEGCLHDDDGINLSALNPYINEMTGIFWMGKNLAKLGNPDYIGINHYRRFLQWSPELLAQNTMIATSLVFARPIVGNICFHLPKNIRNHFIGKVMECMKEDVKRTFARYLKSHIMFPYNMFIMSREMFKEYFSFIEPYISCCANLVTKNEIGIREFEPINKRVLGFILEHISSLWISNMKKCKAYRVITTQVESFNVTN